MFRTSNTVNGILIWDWSKLIPFLANNKQLPSNTIFPTRIDNEYLEFCKIKLNMHSLIYEKANFEDVICGWKELREVMNITDITKSLLFTSYSRAGYYNVKITDLWQVEPNIIIILKLCYWYSRLLQVPSVNSKRKEIRKRLGGRLLRKVKKSFSKSSLFHIVSVDSRIRKELESELNELEQKPDEETMKFLIEYYNFCEVCLAEIIYAVLSDESGHNIQFLPQNNKSQFDFDVKISNRAIQIKNVFSYEILHLNLYHQEQIRKYIDQKNGIDFLYFNDQKGLGNLHHNEIYRNFVKSNLPIFRKAYEQKAEIVIVDITRTWQGYLLNRFYSNDQDYIKWSLYIEQAIKTTSPECLSIILSARATDVFYRVSSIYVKLPISLLTNHSLEEIEIML